MTEELDDEFTCEGCAEEVDELCAECDLCIDCCECEQGFAVEEDEDEDDDEGDDEEEAEERDDDGLA